MISNPSFQNNWEIFHQLIRIQFWVSLSWFLKKLQFRPRLASGWSWAVSILKNFNLNIKNYVCMESKNFGIRSKNPVTVMSVTVVLVLFWRFYDCTIFKIMTFLGCWWPVRMFLSSNDILKRSPTSSNVSSTQIITNRHRYSRLNRWYWCITDKND